MYSKPRASIQYRQYNDRNVYSVSVTNMEKNRGKIKNFRKVYDVFCVNLSSVEYRTKNAVKTKEEDGRKLVENAGKKEDRQVFVSFSVED